VIAVIYGSVTGVSIGSLFLGGAIPGVLCGVAMLILTWFLAPRAGARPIPRAPVSEMASASVRAIPALVMPMIIVGGILGGVFTPTEAGAVAALYALCFGFAIRRHTRATLFANFSNAAMTTAAALVTIGGAALFSWILARAGAAQLALQLMLAVTDNPTVALLILVAFFFLMGTFLEPVPALIITVPVLSPTHVGIIVIMMLVVGSVTPPVGILAMVACKIAGVEYNKTFGMLAPYTGAWMVVVVLVVFNPWMVTWLPSLVMK
jgi:C4-dicarboxylate transporter DctM subunit